MPADCTITALYAYPVKGCRATPVESATVSSPGIEGRPATHGAPQREIRQPGATAEVGDRDGQAHRRDHDCVQQRRAPAACSRRHVHRHRDHDQLLRQSGPRGGPRRRGGGVGLQRGRLRGTRCSLAGKLPPLDSSRRVRPHRRHRPLRLRRRRTHPRHQRSLIGRPQRSPRRTGADEPIPTQHRRRRARSPSSIARACAWSEQPTANAALSPARTRKPANAHRSHWQPSSPTVTAKTATPAA